MEKINALGIECPMPVIMAKRLVKDGLNEFSVLVDNVVATENLEKMAKQTGYNVKIEEISEKEFEVFFTKGDDKTESKINKDSYIVIFDSNKVGEGDEEFGKKLMESFLVALTEQDNYPDYVVCFNKGVELTTVVDNAVEDLKKLSDSGVEILSCGLCLDYYNLKEKLQVGSITNMYRICELMTIYRVVKP